MYNYNKTLTSTNATTQNCQYNQGNNYRRCIADLQNGPRWSNTDLRECRPKTETTQKLITLNLVSFYFILIIIYYIYIYICTNKNTMIISIFRYRAYLLQVKNVLLQIMNLYKT